MQFNPHELKEKLLKALDKDQNVVDMCRVQEVFSILEKFPITRDTLEQTRIGRTVNDLRKKTTDKSLAKRAKNLVRKWQSLISPTNNNVNGEGVVHKTGPVFLPQRALLAGGGSKPNSPASRPNTPYSGNKSNSNSPGLVPNRPTTPASLHASRLSPKGSVMPVRKPDSPSLVTSTPINASHAKAAFNPGLSDTPRSHTNAKHLPMRGHLPSEASSKKNVANKRKRRAEGKSNSEIPEKKPSLGNNTAGDIHQSKGIVLNGTLPKVTSHCAVEAVQTPNGKASNSKTSNLVVRKQANLTVKTSGLADVCTKSEHLTPSSLCSDRSDRPPKTFSSVKTPKVKTTAQLIQDLATRKELRISGSETVAKIAQNRIEKEHEVEVSIVPAGAKPRPRRNPALSLNPPNSSDIVLSRTKNEMVHKFLASSVTASDLSGMLHLNSSTMEATAMDSISHESNISSGHNSFTSVPSPNVKAGKKRDPAVAYLLEQHPHLMGMADVEIIRRLSDDPFSLFLAVNPSSEFPATNPSSEFCDKVHSPPSEPITDNDVERLHQGAWQGVNGYFDHNHDWHDWTQTSSLPSYNGDLLHILPYVSIDD